MSNSTQLLPQASLSILLALSLRERHGYEIIQQVEKDSGGRLRIGPGTLYASLHKLKVAGLIEELEAGDNERRIYYRLTAEGIRRLSRDMEYYEALTLASRRRLASQEGMA